MFDTGDKKQHKGSSIPFLSSLLVDQEMMRNVGDYLQLGVSAEFPSVLDAVGVITGRASSLCKKPLPGSSYPVLRHKVGCDGNVP